MIIKCLRNLAVIVILSGLVINQAQAKSPRRNVDTLGGFSFRGRIIEVNEEHRFAVLNLGRADGVKKGMILRVFHGEEEVARIKTAKVRKHFSACDIQLVYAERGIGIGDVVIYKEPPPFVKMLKPLDPTSMIEMEPIVVDIDAPKPAILSKAIRVFKDFGVVVTESDSTNYTLKASKNLNVPLEVGLFTEWGPFVRNKLYYTVEVTTTARYNQLIIHLRGVYDKEGQLYNREIKNDSPIYKEVQTMAFTIKDLAERL